MAVTYGDIAFLNDIRAVTNTFSSPDISGSHTILLVAVSYRNDLGSVTSVTHNGDSMTSQGTFTKLDITTEWFLLASPDAGINDVVVTMSTTNVDGVASATYFTGSDGTIGTIANTTYDNADPSISVTSATDEVVIDCLAGGTSAGGDPTAGTGQTKRMSAVPAGASFDRMAMSTEAGATSVTMDWTGVQGSGKYGVLTGLSITEGTQVSPFIPKIIMS